METRSYLQYELKTYIMMKNILTFILIITLTSCNEAKQINTNVVFKNSVVPNIISAFIKALSKNKVKNDSTVNIYTSISNDTTFLSISNALPLASDERVITTQVLQDTMTLYIVDNGENKLLSVKHVTPVSTRIEKMRKMPLARIDPIQWIFYFKDTTLVDYSPKNTINKYINITDEIGKTADSNHSN
ncbi:hypothetical protein [Hymenobacter sp. BT491]|uniref:hypothetical protein n=1 Tax=Hymenobacter sp. BT491 TaxID=2766779 RepID=UPI001653AC04|nr:hypothetical protein [Hymenobacter sp. BT491]MBC6988187.1 hypothetical protein [Hymenobacter sp. BT491]